MLVPSLIDWRKNNDYGDLITAQDDLASASAHTSLNPRRENAVERLNLGLDDFSGW